MISKAETGSPEAAGRTAAGIADGKSPPLYCINLSPAFTENAELLCVIGKLFTADA